MSNIDTGELLKAYDAAKTAHVPVVQADHDKHGTTVQPFSAADLRTTFCASWTADKAAMESAAFWLNIFYPKAAVAIKGLEAMGDYVNKQACPVK